MAQISRISNYRSFCSRPAKSPMGQITLVHFRDLFLLFTSFLIKLPSRFPVFSKEIGRGGSARKRNRHGMSTKTALLSEPIFGLFS